MTRPRVLAIIAEMLPCPDPVDNAQRLIEDRGADSLDFVELALRLETEFGIALTDEEVNQLTVGEWADTVEAKVARRAA